MLPSYQAIFKLVFYYAFNFLPEVDNLFFVKYKIFDTLYPLVSNGN